MRSGRLLVVAAATFATAVCDRVERRAGEVAALRRDAVRGIEAVEGFCAERDSVVARAERGEPGAARILEEVLAAPVVLDDYCEEFRFHSHDERAVPGEDSIGADTHR